MNLNCTLILGSKSPRRQELLHKAGIQFKVVELECDETYPPELEIINIPKYLAEKKSKAYKKPIEGNEVLLTADTVVLLNNQILGKPSTKKETKQILKLLSGKTHEVITGVCLRSEKITISFQEKTSVVFTALSEDVIEHYIKIQNPVDKAGAYGIQDWIGLVGVESIIGSYYNVVGLPMHRIFEELKKF